MTSLKSNKFLGVELVRFLSSVCVLIWHYQNFFENPLHGKLVFKSSLQPFYQVLFPFYEHGEFAVKVFWMISGFIFIWKYSEKIFNKAISFKEFFILRFSRLYPLHFITLLLVAVLQIIYVQTHHHTFRYFIYPRNNTYHFILNLFFIQHWGFNRGYSFNGPTWSISVEILIYGIFFLIAKMMRLSAVRSFLLAFIAWVVFWNFYPYPPFAECAMWFFFGGFIFYVYDRIHPFLSYAQSLLAGLLLILMPFYFLTFPSVGMMDWRVLQIIISNIVLLGVVLVFSNGYFKTFLEALGNLTYASYLSHFPIQLSVIIILDELGISHQIFLSPWAFIAYILLVLAVAQVVYTKIEYPLMGMIRKKLAQRR